jgi:ankyrin repeat protein
LLITNLLTGSDLEFEQALEVWIASKGSVPVNILGQSAVHLAILSPSRLERLLESGMDPDPVHLDLTTPMMYAAAYGRLDSVILLMQHGSRLDRRDKLNDRHFESYAICYGHIHLVEGLVRWLRDEVERGAEIALDILDRCIHYHTVNASATMDMGVPILEALLELKADPDIMSSAKNTLMHLIDKAEYGKVLIKHGFTAAAVQNKDGETALMHVVSFLDPALTKSLLSLQLSAGVSIDQRDVSHWTALLHLVKHMRYRYSGSWDTTEIRYQRKTDAIRCLNYLLRQGAEVLLTDTCKCPCSPGGCSAMSVALHHALEVTRPTSFREVLDVLPIDLAIAILARGEEKLRTWADTVATFSSFIESGEKHSCCALSSVQSRLWLSSAEGAQVTDSQSAIEACRGASTVVGNATSEKDRLINQLARFYTLLERRSQARYEKGMAVKIKTIPVYGPSRPKKPKPSSWRSVWVDLRVERAQKLELQDYRAWISDCKKKNLQLYTGMSLEAWSTDALEVVNGLDREMERLRAEAR